MINSREIRVIDSNGEQLGIMKPYQALELAESQNLDLVEISPNAQPPVCKIMDYGKFKFDKNKKDKENKKKQKKVVVKEIRIKPHIDVSDKETKINQITKFIEKEYKVKVSLRLSGREKAHSEAALKVLDDISDRLKDVAKIEKFYGKEQVQKYIIISSNKI